MMKAAFVCAILLSALSPTTVPEGEGIKEASALISASGMLVSLIPEATASYQEKEEKIRRYAEQLSEEYGTPVLVTEDLGTHMILCRIERRGMTEYERRNLIARKQILTERGTFVSGKGVEKEEILLFSCTKHSRKI